MRSPDAAGLHPPPPPSNPLPGPLPAPGRRKGRGGVVGEPSPAVPRHCFPEDSGTGEERPMSWRNGWPQSARQPTRRGQTHLDPTRTDRRMIDRGRDQLCSAPRTSTNRAGDYHRVSVSHPARSSSILPPPYANWAAVSLESRCPSGQSQLVGPSPSMPHRFRPAGHPDPYSVPAAEHERTHGGPWVASWAATRSSPVRSAMCRRPVRRRLAPARSRRGRRRPAQMGSD